MAKGMKLNEETMAYRKLPVAFNDNLCAHALAIPPAQSRPRRFFQIQVSDFTVSSAVFKRLGKKIVAAH